MTVVGHRVGFVLRRITINIIISTGYYSVHSPFPKSPENMVDVEEVMLVISLLNDEKKSLPVPATRPPALFDWVLTSEEPGGGCLCGGECGSSIWFFMRPFLAAASFALFVKSPSVDFPTYVRSSKVFLLAPAACLDASRACFDASSAFFLACSVNWKITDRTELARQWHA